MRLITDLIVELCELFVLQYKFSSRIRDVDDRLHFSIVPVDRTILFSLINSVGEEHRGNPKGTFSLWFVVSFQDYIM